MPALKEGLEEWVKERISPQEHANSENVHSITVQSKRSPPRFFPYMI